jgi:uncharacterized membrane protein YeiB
MHIDLLPDYLSPMLIGMGLMKLGFFTGRALLCQLLVESYQLMYVVFGVWIIILTISPLWLRKFALGPLGWCWRSLTYGTVQPMRLKTMP